MHAAITAGVGFLIAVLWFDLMFDVQIVAHRRAHRCPTTGRLRSPPTTGG
ncbi:MAG: hypothetical protein IPL07_05445 [Acidimicrobiaceae bacterium]|nr:hypothetical protein [Acidimicrobiaceae bacterium]